VTLSDRTTTNDAERRDARSHAERGNEGNEWERGNECVSRAGAQVQHLRRILGES